MRRDQRRVDIDRDALWRRLGLLPDVLRLPGSSWNFDGDPTGIVMLRR
jgi:hypothetical protein